MKQIPYGKQNITNEDIAAVVETLQSDYLTQGPKVNEFEEAFANYIGSRYAVAVSNGTAALHLSALALGVKPGDKIITTPITFAASANCVRFCGGDVVFSDIDAETFLIDLKRVELLLESNPKGTYKGIIPVDFAGFPVDLEALRKLANKYGLWIIEDACHAPGGFFTDSIGRIQFCGNGNFADLAIFSFHPVKHIATGEGGMVTTNNKALYERILSLRTHGITKDSSTFQNSVEFAGAATVENFPGWYMEMQTLGYNYRLTDFQAALGISQLTKATIGLSRRKILAKNYDIAFKDHPKIKSQLNELGSGGSSHAYHLYVVEVVDRYDLYNYLRGKRILTQIHYIPCHLMPYYRKLGWNEGDMPNAEKYYSRCISLPMYPSLTNEEQDFVISSILSFYSNQIY